MFDLLFAILTLRPYLLYIIYIIHCVITLLYTLMLYICDKSIPIVNKDDELKKLLSWFLSLFCKVFRKGIGIKQRNIYLIKDSYLNTIHRNVWKQLSVVGSFSCKYIWSPTTFVKIPGKLAVSETTSHHCLQWVDNRVTSLKTITLFVRMPRWTSRVPFNILSYELIQSWRHMVGD